MADRDLLDADVDVRAVIVYDPVWPELFAALGRDLRAGLGSVALRIDHVGSTAVAGLAAKREGDYASALGSGGVSRIDPDSPPGVGRRGSRTPADPNPCGKSPQPKLSVRRVRQTLQR